MDEVRFRSSERAVWASVGVTPSERRVRLVRTGCTVRVQESGSGPAVLFVHGAASGGTSWADLVARLQGFRCVMVDRPGCALSDPLPAPLRRIEQIEAYADGFVVDVLDALDLERAHVVATSYGGYFALRGAAAHPERFERIVELGWTIGAPMSKVPFILRLLAVPGVGRVLSVSCRPTSESFVGCCAKPGWEGHSTPARSHRSLSRGSPRCCVTRRRCATNCPGRLGSSCRSAG